MKKIIEQSALTCPNCAHKETLTMPTDACLWYHECSSCKALLKPKSGDCCVFCSYGAAPCPPIQLGSCDCGGTEPSLLN